MQQPFERTRGTRVSHPGAAAFPSAGPELDNLADGQPIAPAVIRLDAPAVLVEARFGALTLAGRLLAAGATRAFTIGVGRGVDAPVNPAYLGEPAHDLVTAHALGFAINLSPAMRAELRTDTQRLALPPDAGVAQAALALPEHAFVRVSCGEMTFEVRAAAPVSALPPPAWTARWRETGRYTLAVAAATLLLLITIFSVPSDPKALVVEDFGLEGRLAKINIMAPEVPPPPPLPAATGGGAAGKAAAGAAGKAGDRAAPARARRMAVKGDDRAREVRPTSGDVAAAIEAHSILGLLRAREGTALAEALAEPALGSDAENVLGNLHAPIIGTAYGVGGLSSTGTGAGGGDTGRPMLDDGHLGTIGGRHAGDGTGPAYGDGVGRMGPRKSTTPQFLPGDLKLKGSLDKEIVRRIVRRHLNEVRFCYEERLARRPGLSGRVVVNFTIAQTGRVLISALASSSLGDAATESCIVAAARRWEFPQPSGGGLVVVSYPFQLAPAGG